MELKDVLKSLKMNESKISAILGVLVIVVIGLMVFNYFRNIQTGSTTPTAVTQTAEEPEVRTHTVEAGESLSSIAREEYGNPNNWTAIRDANNIENSNQLAIGQELIIPDLDATPAASTIAQVTPAASVEPVATISPTDKPVETIKPVATPANNDSEEISDTTVTSYTVQHGDSLWKIAENVYGDGYQWTKIAQANNLKNPNIIHTGNVFSIPR